jgi:hypothetical protein
MDGILKRLVGLNQVLLVVLSLCFYSCYGRRVSAEALDVARDLEALQNLRGADGDPAVSCGHAALQEALDQELRARPEGAGYNHVRESLFGFLKTGLRLGDAEIARVKAGGPAAPTSGVAMPAARAYFLIDPKLATPGTAGQLCLRTGNDSLPVVPRTVAAPDSVEAIVERSRVAASSKTIVFPVEWTPPADPKSAVPASCLAAAPGNAPPGQGAGTPAGSLPSLLNNDCQLTAVVFDGESIAFLWSVQRQVQRAPLDASDARKAFPAKAAQLDETVPFVLAHMPSVEAGWLKRIEDIAGNDDRRRAIVSRYGGLSIETAIAQSQKTYSDLVGNVTLFGWNLLPEWFPLAVDGVLVGCLLSIFVTCRHARRLHDWDEKRQKVVELESIVFLSLLTPAATFVTWALLPLLALGMSASYANGGAALLAEFALAAGASTMGGIACALFWGKPAARPVA